MTRSVILRDKDDRVNGRHGAAEEWRTSAQVDADRVWYCAEFRRLEGVTQVVPPQDDYVFHDRLTHSVKVAQVAATIARRHVHEANMEGSALSTTLAGHGVKIEDWVDPEYCYVAGLAHDIGHPPYGHAGEAALQSLAARREGSLRERSFEGNAQSIRIVSRLSFRKPDSDGLDLTLRSLAAIAKYPWVRGQHPSHVKKLAKKWSFYDEDRDLLDALRIRGFVAEEIKAPSPSEPSTGADPKIVIAVHRWPEAAIMDWADDISYAVHDLEDFYRAGRIPLHRIASAFSNVPKHLWGKLDEDARESWKSTKFFELARNDEEVRSALLFARDKMSKALSEDGESLAAYVPDAFVQIHAVLHEAMPVNRFDGSRSSHIDLQRFASETITYLTANTSIAVVHVSSDTRVAFRVAPAARVVAEFFKAICQFYVIESSALATMQHGQSLALERICDALVAMSVSWLEQRDNMSRRASLPARLVEYLAARFANSAGFRKELVEIEGALAETATTADDVNELVARRDEILRSERDEILICVFDYLCGLRDLQTSILDERLFGTRSALSLASSWMDV